MASGSFAETLHLLERALDGPLPGAAAQSLMAPRPRPGWNPSSEPPRGLRDAATLVLIYPKAGRATIPFTLRPHHLEVHRGQISFPGGAVEAGESPEEAALREASEEIGLPGDDVRILGRLSPLHIPVSGFLVHPILATRASAPSLRPDPREVSAIVEVSLAHLLDSARWETMETRAGRLRVPLFPTPRGPIWGATAMILAELLSLLGWSGPPSPGEGGRP
jgi:8-oxo-dGTP pyrophosphatase MutT (NUDIX family)